MARYGIGVNKTAHEDVEHWRFINTPGIKRLITFSGLMRWNMLITIPVAIRGNVNLGEGGSRLHG